MFDVPPFPKFHANSTTSADDWFRKSTIRGEHPVTLRASKLATGDCAHAVKPVKIIVRKNKRKVFIFIFSLKAKI